MPHPFDIGDYGPSLFKGLSGFWQRFFRDTKDLEAYYQASEQLLGQVYLDLMSTVLGTGLVDCPIFNKEYWKLFLIGENDISFLEGESTSEDRYLYDMPGSTVDVSVLQNTIFEPDITFEKDVDFDVENDDGLLRFVNDPFRTFQDIDTGEWLPRPGVAWRWATIEVGNQFADLKRPEGLDWRDDTDVKKGDVLRLLAYAGAQQQEGSDGQFIFGGDLVFKDVVSPAAFTEAHIGDIIEIYEDPSNSGYRGYYVVKDVNPLFPTQVFLELTYGAVLATSAANLKWRHYKGLYFESFVEDYELDFISSDKLIGNADTPFPLDYDAPIVYSVVRWPSDYEEVGVNVNNPPAYATPATTVLGYKHIVPGTVEVFASRNDGFRVQEGVDYTVDYLRGLIHTIPYTAPAPPGDLTQPDWNPSSPFHTCNFQHMKEVLIGSGGKVEERTEAQVRQISLWVPEIEIDRFTLYNNFGYMLNRFEVSSDTYKKFLRGIMYLYASGPILYRINAALNVAAGFPVIQSDGEILRDYDDGADGTGFDGQIISLFNHFTTPSYSFSELDVGGYVVFPSPANDANRGSFRILEVVDENTVLLETTFGLADEGPPLEWAVTRSNVQTVYTETAGGLERQYQYPYGVPMLDLVLDPDNYDVTSFSAFDYLTDAFRVVDYIEDPQWWVNKYIPEILWPDQGAGRRLASDVLFPNIIGPPDDAQIGDPGFFIGADDYGNVFAPTDPYTSDPALLHRHNAAFILFDRYLKFHMFYIGIDDSVELDTQFLADLEELILVVKPAYTYPYVEPGDAFFDSAELWDEFLMNIMLDLSGEHGDNIQVADENYWHIGDPFSIGDYFRYVRYDDEPAGVSSPPPPWFALPIASNERIIALKINATVGGREVLEGVDYTFDYDPTSPTAWRVTPITTWDAAGSVTFDALVIALTNLTLGTPDTTIGYTPLAIGLPSPGYVRETLTPIPMVTELIDRALSLHIDADYPNGVPYTY